MDVVLLLIMTECKDIIEIDDHKKAEEFAEDVID